MYFNRLEKDARVRRVGARRVFGASSSRVEY